MKANRQPISLLWLRRDLRLHDHAALHAALASGAYVQPIFIFDSDILQRFPNKNDRRLSFIADILLVLEAKLQKRGGGLLIFHGAPKIIMPKLVHALNAEAVFAAQDYEPETIARDQLTAKALGKTQLILIKDQLIFAPSEITRKGEPYKVFTPYAKAWKNKLTPSDYGEYIIRDAKRYADINTAQKAVKATTLPLLDAKQGAAHLLKQISYEYVSTKPWGASEGRARLKRFCKTTLADYNTLRNFPAIDGTSQLSPYLRFGLVSIREAMREAAAHKNDGVWIKELIWREFYAMILFHHPASAKDELNLRYKRTLNWSRSANFKAWQMGKTGYPIVDAAMRQLLEIGWMHNRARMIVASFLTKDLLIDWRLGEEHFAQYLIDYDLASNVGGWQWAASTGTDAQPWFRIFNPSLQSAKFDSEALYIKRHVPELKKIATKALHDPEKYILPAAYPTPIVEHKQARETALSMFKRVNALALPSRQKYPDR